jgi:4'-phosphopantetheinyl transferase
MPKPPASKPPEIPELVSRRSVHVWQISLDAAGEGSQRRIPLGQPEAVLAPDERARAARFHFDRDRYRFVMCRAWLRTILAGLVGAAPNEVAFTYGKHGKPALAAPWNASGIQFNLTHTRNLALIAVARDIELGIDVEYARPLPDARQIAARYFSPRERGALDRLPPGVELAVFYTIWTRKEACLKAAGMGLSYPPERIDVGAAAADPIRFLSPSGNASDAPAWAVRSFNPTDGYVAAIASPNGLPDPEAWIWPDAPHSP